jgi:ribosomal protein S18 acetylase RimI-like enzyme
LAPPHQRKGFSCGVPTLDHYLAELATQDMKRRISNCFVMLDDHGAVVGYYTFASTSIPLNELPAEETKKLPRDALLPAALIGRLAIDERYKGQRLGGSLVMDAVHRAVRSESAIFALIVDAKNELAVSFYEHLGFKRYVGKPMSLYLPIATALKAFELATVQ